jgi:hypothetical protein
LDLVFDFVPDFDDVLVFVLNLGVFVDLTDRGRMLGVLENDEIVMDNGYGLE